MKAKEYLQQLKNIDVKIKQKIEEINALKNLAESTVASSDAERVQTSMCGDKIPLIVTKYLDMEREVNNDIDKYINLRHEIIEELHSMNNVLFIDILFKRYVEFKTLELIAVETGYSYQHIRNQHGYALLEFQKILDRKIQYKKVQKSTF